MTVFPRYCNLAVTLAAVFALAARLPAGEAAAIAPAQAQAAPSPKASLDISSQVDRSEITIGDQIHYEIKVVYPAKGRIELPSVLGNLGSFEVKDYQVSDPKPAGNLELQTWKFTLSTFTVGKYMIPVQQVVYLPEGASLPAPKAGNDSVTGDSASAQGPEALPPGAAVYYTQPIEINVVRTSPETVKDIADIAGPVETGKPFPWLAYGLVMGIITGAAAFLLLRRRHVKAAVEKPLPPPFEEAMARLADINSGAMVRANRGRELCFLLSEVLRRYVTRRWGVDAIDMTTTEFLAEARKLPVTAAHKEFIVRFAEGTDLVKFADAPILESEAETLLARLKEFLTQTRPKDPPPGDAPEAAQPGASGPAAAAKTPSTRPAPSAPSRRGKQP
jgi:hypothetical protein